MIAASRTRRLAESWKTGAQRVQCSGKSIQSQLHVRGIVHARNKGSKVTSRPPTAEKRAVQELKGFPRAPHECFPIWGIGPHFAVIWRRLLSS